MAVRTCRSHIGLISQLQSGRRHVRFQKVGNALEGVDLVVYPREAVAFVFIDLVVHYSVALLDGVDYLLRF